MNFVKFLVCLFCLSWPVQSHVCMEKTNCKDCASFYNSTGCIWDNFNGTSNFTCGHYRYWRRQRRRRELYITNSTIVRNSTYGAITDYSDCPTEIENTYDDIKVRYSGGKPIVQRWWFIGFVILMVWITLHGSISFYIHGNQATHPETERYFKRVRLQRQETKQRSLNKFLEHQRGKLAEKQLASAGHEAEEIKNPAILEIGIGSDRVNSPMYYKIISENGLVVRTGVEASSEVIKTLARDTMIKTIVRIGNRINIGEPIDGWISVQTAEGIPLIEPMDKTLNHQATLCDTRTSSIYK